MLRLLLILLVIFLVSFSRPSEALDLPPTIDEYRILAPARAILPPDLKDGERVLPNFWEMAPRSSRGVMADPQSYFRFIYPSDGRGSYIWPIDPNFIAQSVKGNGVSDAEINGLLADQLKEIGLWNGPVMLKVASFQAHGPLFVRSIKPFNIHNSYERALKLGSPILNLDAVEVRRMSQKDYQAAIDKFCGNELSRLKKQSEQTN